jgi:hypothetical protein
MNLDPPSKTLDLLGEDSWRNVYPGELEVPHNLRPPLVGQRGACQQALGDGFSELPGGANGEIC